MDRNTCLIILSYFTNRKQSFKLGDSMSDWRHISKGAPQGSLFGPFMYKVFSNGLLFVLNHLNDIFVYNYADDTTITCSNMHYDTAHTKLLDASEVMIHWFENNNLKANLTKFQLIVFDGTNKQRSLAIHGTDLQSSFQENYLVCRLINLFYSQNISLNYA